MENSHTKSSATPLANAMIQFSFEQNLVCLIIVHPNLRMWQKKKNPLILNGNLIVLAKSSNLTFYHTQYAKAAEMRNFASRFNR